MYLLYLDESGNENDPSDRYFVLAGLALFERQIHHLSQRLERVQEEHFPNRPPIPFHASAIRAGRGFWRGVSEEKRREILDDVIAAITATEPPRRLEALRRGHRKEYRTVRRARRRGCHRTGLQALRHLPEETLPRVQRCATRVADLLGRPVRCPGQAVGQRVSAPWNPVGFHLQPGRHSVFRPNEGITIAPSGGFHRTRNLALV
ncbi:MAG: DUF3800 domain-containing protein [Gemmatimonadetes bacterium]|nr:DUF3800 domain-containing protein [Gemmatimonadota bacterium]